MIERATVGEKRDLHGDGVLLIGQDVGLLALEVAEDCLRGLEIARLVASKQKDGAIEGSLSMSLLLLVAK